MAIATQKVQVKVFVDGGEQALEAVVPVFHRWIAQASLEDELLIDVVDYGHVHQGPGVVLVGHGSDYYLDLADGRPGLLYSRKRQAPEGGIGALLADGIRRALTAARLLEGEPSLDGSLRFRTDQLLLRLPDRLRAPNAPETLEALRPALEPLLDRLWGAGAHSVEAEGDPKRPFGVEVLAASSPGVTALLERLPARSSG